MERRIRALRESLERLGISTDHPLTPLEWETAFMKVANLLNNVPIAKGNPSSKSDIGYDILTPNRLLLGRNNYRSLTSAGITVELGVQYMLDQNNKVVKAWFQLFMDRLHLFTIKPEKWLENTRPVQLQDIVIFVLSDSGQGKRKYEWKMGEVILVDKMKVEIRFSTLDVKGNLKKETLSRSARDVSILFSEGEFRVNSTEYFKIYSTN